MLTLLPFGGSRVEEEEAVDDYMGDVVGGG